MQAPYVYRALSRFGFLSYRGKILCVAFVGTHVPLIVLAFYLAVRSAPGWQTALATVGVTLIATLVGTAATLFALNELLRPIGDTSRALRRYRETRQKTALPTRYTDEVGVLMADAEATIDHLEQARDTLEHIDENTSLPNRKKLLQLMESRTRTGGTFALCVVRLANVARIADAVDLAHAERAVGLIAKRLQSRVQPGSVVARIDQSDFAVFRAQRAGDGNNWTATLDRVRRLIEQCGGALALHAIEIEPELRCGVATFPHDADDAKTLLDHAVAAAAQATSAAPVILHSSDARRAAFTRLTIEQHLRRALEEDEFFLCYQPVVDVAGERVVGAEALLRWHRPDQGLVSPAHFIPAAEASGLIEPIGRWVMRESCEQLRRWRAAGMDGMRLSINLSARQFLDQNLHTHIAQAIDQSGIDACQIELELTETSAMQDIAHSREMLTRLRELGVTMTIDDFGTGYASMTYLRNLPLDKLKIDREFVTDVHRRPDSQAICRSIIALAHGFGLTVLAEGIENAEEARYLTNTGCSLFQGFYYAEPLPADEFVAACRSLPALLADRNRAEAARVALSHSIG